MGNERLNALLETLHLQGLDETWASDSTIRPSPVRDDADVSASLGEDAPDAPDITLSLPEMSVDAEEAELRIREKLGEGGMGYVQLAEQSVLEREVALKRILPRRRSRLATEALLKEARVTGRLEHPNIVPVHALGRLGEAEPVMVMKRVEGVVWRELLRDANHSAWTRLDVEDRLEFHLEVLLQVCLAVEFAHSRGVLHLDVKTENVMLGAFGEVYLMDWGVARVLSDPMTPDEETMVVGTPSSMAPEMVQGKGQTTTRSDVFLLGATLHEVLTGRSRHRGENVMKVMFEAMQAPPHTFPPTVPEELAAICNRACSAEPEERHASVAEFRRALNDFLSHRSALELSDASLARLEELRALVGASDSDPSQLQGIFGACRFGFEQSLREWPGNSAARLGLQSCLTLMIEHELDQLNANAAGALLAALPEARPDLQQRLDALRTRLEEEGDARERLAVIRRETTMRGRTWASSIGFTVNGVVWGAFGLIAQQIINSGWLPDLAQANLILGLIGPVVMGLIILRFRKLFFGNTIRRQFTLTFFVYALVFLSNRLIGLVAGVSFYYVTLMDHVSLTVFIGAIASLVHSGLWIAFVGCILSMWCAAHMPNHVFTFGSASLLLTNLVIAYAVRPDPDLPDDVETLF